MQTTLKRSIPAVIAGTALLSSMLFAAPAFAAGPGWHGFMGRMHRPGVVGLVASVSGTTLTVTSMGFGHASSTAATTYTVDAANATVTKDGASSTVSAIASGDKVMIEGTVNGTSVTATKIFDGMPGRGEGPKSGKGPGALAGLQGNGQPVIGGSVSAISGNTLTVVAKAGTTYSVDATSAKIIKDNATSTLSAIATSDNVVVQGAVNGTNITASSVIDGGTPPSGATPPRRGFMGRIGGIFSRIFGFF